MSLRSEVDKFKSWASKYPEQSRSGEWEYDYPSWAPLYDLLYALARDNEMGIIAEQISSDTDILISLSRRSIDSTEGDAKWQLAAQLGTLLRQKQEAEECLLQLVEDKVEYVSRRALLSLGSIKSI